MSNALSTVDREPLAIRAAVTTAVTAVVHVAVVLGLPLDGTAELAIGSAVDAVGLVALIVWARPNITANAKVLARVTTDGRVVAGDAAVEPTGTEVDQPRARRGSSDRGSVSYAEGPRPVIAAVAVKPELVPPTE